MMLDLPPQTRRAVGLMHALARLPWVAAGALAAWMCREYIDYIGD